MLERGFFLPVLLISDQVLSSVMGKMGAFRVIFRDKSLRFRVWGNACFRVSLCAMFS